MEDPFTRMKKEIYEWATLGLLLVSFVVLLEAGIIFDLDLDLAPIALIGTIGGIIGRLLGYLEVHKWIDNRGIFSARKRVDNEIADSIIDSPSKIIPPLNPKSEEHKQMAMSVFYDFVNEEEATRNLAFTYWGDYYVSLYLILYSYISTFMSAILVGATFRLGHFQSMAISILGTIVGVICFLVLYFKIRVGKEKNLFRHARNQLEKIRAEQCEALRDKMEKRLNALNAK